MKTNKIMMLLLSSVLLVTGCSEKKPNSGESIDISQSADSTQLSETVSLDSEETPSTSRESLPSEDSGVSSEIQDSVEAYYADVSAMSYGTTLLEDVRSLITRTHKKQTTYGGLKNVFIKSDADPKKNGNILWFYTGTSKAFSDFGGSVGQTNREHVWPKDNGKAFPAESQAGSDAHHLRPMETQLNSIRGSKSFGEVAQIASNIAKEAKSTSYASGDYLAYTDKTYFYPAKGYRGQTARILFYVQARWGSDYNLKFVLGSGASKTIGDIATLMKWHLEEPVTPLEALRNEVVYKEQGNRNPFIDMPQYACRIYANDGQSYNGKLKTVCNM